MTNVLLSIAVALAGTAGAQVKALDQAKGMGGADAGSFAAPSIGAVKYAEPKAAAGAAAAPAASAAPDFTLTDLKGKKMSLSEHKGKVVLLDFFATWCPPCRASTPWVIEQHKKLAAQGFVVLAIAADPSEGRATIEEYVKAHGMTYQTGIDETKSVQRISEYASRGIPTFVVINRDGSVKTKITGFYQEQIQKAIDEAMAAK
ncbi:MAG: TlpA family protein disulfide reductase [Elusimicrobia bacterium]|nr:TlpA family protein disulfide reductase [Elusimicrobiota bacterium]